MKDYWVLLGSFGSGKSELAINMALQAVKKGPCTLIDLDVVNAYFRSSERGDVLGAAGVELISPPFALDKIEILALSARVRSSSTSGATTSARSRWASTSSTSTTSRRTICTSCSLSTRSARWPQTFRAHSDPCMRSRNPAA